MKYTFSAAIAALMIATPVLAEGDAEAGKKAFNKCKACHAVVTASDEVIVKGGKTGPNLYGIIGQTAGTVEGYKYGPSLVAAGEGGLVWDETTFVEYTTDPKKFLQTYLDDPKAKSKMTFKLKKGGEDIYAFLTSASE
ncbi:cytochrome C [Ruegeria sp. 2205SS24-7]|uniref:c-type cytochrome n=1 Tax=Ruegeria discodermiae TaxID=3064389 RepID=UPI00274182FE|nr:cytochrome C [Ruegeria sp. 2205SS24-7]MDP5217732.1 cytochrome C [Ruegeria sp. 2205SS24-7]